MAKGPVEVQGACRAALAELAGAFASSDVIGSREEWAAAVAATQRVIDVASAAQDAAIVRLAAIEPEWLDDGTEMETHRALGHLALDSPAILSGVLSTSALHAERRVRDAVLLAADGPAGSGTDTGLGGLHVAMAAGRLDSYRAGVIAAELEHAPPQVRASVVAAVEAHFDAEDGPHLRRRCRRMMARISPDLLRQRAERARAESRLRRWVDEPGVDHWEGTFPSEEAARAWAAIDALARQYVVDGVFGTIDRARAKALTDLVAGNVTVETVLTVTVPAAALPGPAAGASGSAVAEGDLVEVTGPTAGQPVLVSRQWLSETAESASSVEVALCHPVTGALLDADPRDHSNRGSPSGGASTVTTSGDTVTRVKRTRATPGAPQQQARTHRRSVLPHVLLKRRTRWTELRPRPRPVPSRLWSQWTLGSVPTGTVRLPGWRGGSGRVTGGAASPAARSQQCSATSSTSDRGPPGELEATTSSASADGTTGSSSAAAGASPSTSVGSPPGPTPPAGYAPPFRSMPCEAPS